MTAEKDYSPADIEKKWQQYWQDNKTFKTEGSSEKKMYVLDMFPYPSGSGLHMGHPLGYTGSDIFSRYLRHKGYDVLHPMGYDAFGLPAEQHAINTGEHPAEITQENCKRFTEQLKSLGYSYDWDREIFTCVPEYYKWTQWIFLKLYNSWFDEEQQKARPIEELPIPAQVRAEGDKAIFEYQAAKRLAYIDEAPVNWCPALGTVLANEEVIDGKSERGGHDVIRKPMRQWLLRITAYAERLLNDLQEIEWPENIKEQQRNWIGRKTGAEIVFNVADSDITFKAFTTRPDTLFGVTFFVISPEHPDVAAITTKDRKKEVDAYCEKALHLSDLDRTIENREKTGVFSGSYVVNPITEEKVPLYIGDYVLMTVGTGAVMGVPAHDERDFAFAKKFELPIVPVIVPKDGDAETVKAISDSELCYTQAGVMHTCEAKVFNELKLEGLDSKLAYEKIVDWLQDNSLGEGVINYRLRDWLFSRQRYWGEPIPVVHWEDGTHSAIETSELPLVLPDVKEYKPSEDGESPLARAGSWLDVTCATTGRKGRRETNTMPQWAGSCWYYLRFIDPHNSEELCCPKKEKNWMPVDLYIGGAEHAVLHLLYSRFWHKVLFDLGVVSTNEPFQKLFNQGMLVNYAFKDDRGALVPVDEVQEKDGVFVKTKTGEAVEKITAKMSKSLRNVVNPDDVISEYGSDTLRMFLMFLGPLESMKPWDSQAIAGVFRFLKKTWSLVNAALADGLVAAADEDVEVKKAIALAVQRVDELTAGIRYNTAISSLMECVNAMSAKKISKESIESLLILLSPYAPHIAEELWERVGNKESISKAAWPDFDASLLVEDEVNVVIQIKGKKRSMISVPVEIEEALLKTKVIEEMQGGPYEVKEGDKFITVFEKGSKKPKLVNVIPM